MLLAQADVRPLFEFSIAPLFEEHGLALAGMGVFVVFVALGIVIAFISLLSRALADETDTPSVTLVSDVSEPDELSEELVAVITAAVATVLETPHRIVRIRGLTPGDMGWSLEGRMLHHHSHNVPYRSRR